MYSAESRDRSSILRSPRPFHTQRLHGNRVRAADHNNSGDKGDDDDNNNNYNNTFYSYYYIYRFLGCSLLPKEGKSVLGNQGAVHSGIGEVRSAEEKAGRPGRSMVGVTNSGRHKQASSPLCCAPEWLETGTAEQEMGNQRG